MGGDITVRMVTTARERRQFISFPYTLYRKTLKNPYWAAPLRIDEKTLFNRAKHPFYQHAEVQEFLAYRNGSPVGRIAGISDALHHQYREKGVAYFGFFECVDAPSVAHALFDAVHDWARKRQLSRIIGPINLSTNHILGTLLNDFEGVPKVQVPYNPDYYPALIDSYGFGKEKDHFAFYVDKDKNEVSPKMRRVVNLVRSNKRIMIRTVDMKNFWNDVESAKHLYNSAFHANSDFVPWTDEEFQFMAKDLKLAIIPELTFIAFVDGKPAGISISLHNFNDILVKMNGRLFPTGIFKLLTGVRKLKDFRLAILGVLPEYRHMGIDVLFVVETFDRAVEVGYTGAELSLILEDNHALVNMFDKWGVPPYRTYRVYGKETGATD